MYVYINEASERSVPVWITKLRLNSRDVFAYIYIFASSGEKMSGCTSSVVIRWSSLNRLQSEHLKWLFFCYDHRKTILKMIFTDALKWTFSFSLSELQKQIKIVSSVNNKRWKKISINLLRDPSHLKELRTHERNYLLTIPKAYLINIVRIYILSTPKIHLLTIPKSFSQLHPEHSSH